MHKLTGKDKHLGIGKSITRRDFIGSTLAGSGAVLLSGCAPAQLLSQQPTQARLHPWDGYGGVGDYADSNGNTQAVMDAAHVLRDGATAIDVRHEGDTVRITYLRNGRADQVRARTAVISASGQMARRIVNDMPEAIRDNYARFHHGPVLVANVALNNWRFLHRLGIGAGRWYDGFGFFGSIRAPMKVGGQTAPHHPDLPTVMTFYVPFHTPGLDIDTQGRVGRGQLLGKSYLDYEREIRSHMNELFGSAGFEAKRDIAGIILNRWGHAYIAPQPGFYFGGENGEGLTAPMKRGHGRILYGHSELGWRMNYRNAIAEGGRAGEQAANLLA